MGDAGATICAADSGWQFSFSQTIAEVDRGVHSQAQNGRAGDTPTPPGDALTIDVTDLAVESYVQASDAPISTDSGWVALTITAQHPRNEPAWVSLQTVAPNEKASATFGYDLHCTSGGCGSDGGYNFVWDDKIGFAAGQTRRYVFDRHVEPGTYTLREFFNIDTTSSTSFEISAH